MLRFWVRQRRRRPEWRRRLVLFAAALVLCVTILAITVVEKFSAGRLDHGAGHEPRSSALCFLMRRALPLVRRQGRRAVPRAGRPGRGRPRRAAPRAGRSTRRSRPPRCWWPPTGAGDPHPAEHLPGVSRPLHRQVVFISVGVVDSGEFKGEDAVEELRAADRGDAGPLRRPRRRSSGSRHRADGDRHRRGRDRGGAVPRGGPGVPQGDVLQRRKLIFQRDRWYQRLLHNETALAIQKRLQWAGRTMVLMPIRVRESV